MEETPSIRISRIISGYYRQVEAELGTQYFESWIMSMDEPEKSTFEKMGFEKCKYLQSFQCFVTKLKDEGLERYLLEHLSISDYRYWKRHGK